jgi:hypothetical protein
MSMIERTAAYHLAAEHLCMWVLYVCTPASPLRIVGGVFD